MKKVDNFIIQYPQVAAFVFEETDKYAQEANDNDRISNKIMRRLSKYFESTVGGHKHFKRIRYIVHREIAQAKEEYRKRKYNVVSFGELATVDGVGAPMEFEVEDDSLQVADVVIGEFAASDIQKKITRLATSDRDLEILKALFSGKKTNDIANALAGVFGGNPDSHVRYINRFKDKCWSIIESDSVAV